MGNAGELWTSTMKAFLKRYQIIIFFTLTFIISWYPWYSGGEGFFAWGPSAAGLIVTAVVAGRKGIVVMLRRLICWRVKFRYWAVALFGPFIVMLTGIAIYILIGGESPSFAFWKEEWFLTPLFMLVFLAPMFGPGGEEPFGWRGYAQPQLQAKFKQWWGPLLTSFIIGTAWGIWHLPEFFNPSSTQYALGIGFLGPFIMMEISNSIVMTWLFNKTGASVLIAGVVYHLMLDLSATLLLDITLTGLMAGEVVSVPDFGLLWMQVVVMVITALIFVIATKGRLGYAAKAKSESELNTIQVANP
jgi:membrane protease YdiL (CAAX protease family)